MSQRSLHFWIILFAAGAVLFMNLGGPRLWDIDEPRNATCAREMMQRGDWVVPTFNQELRTDKPVLLYWGMILAYQVFGVGEFAARFWSALCGVGTVLLTYQLGRRLFAREVGLWAALLITSGLMFVVAARAATPDSVLIFCVTLSLYLFARATFPLQEDSSAKPSAEFGRPPVGWIDWIGIYSAMGLAVLAKGPVGVLFPTAIIGVYYLYLHTPFRPEQVTATGWRGKLLTPLVWLLRTFDPLRVAANAWQMRPILLVAVVLLVALPWYLLVGLRTDWEWPKGFLGDHNLGRFSAPMEGHRGPVYYYIIAMAVGFFPGSVFLAPTLLHTWRLVRTDPRRRAVVFLVIWIAMFVLVFSCAATKLPSYISPIYPALALLTGHLLQTAVTAPKQISQFWMRAAFVSLGIVGCCMLFGLTYAIREFLPGNEQLALIGVIPLSASIVCLWLFEQRQEKSMARVFAFASVAFSALLFGWAPAAVNPYQEANLIENARRDVDHLAAFGPFNPSWVFYAGTSIPRYGESTDAACYLQGGRRRGLVTTADYLAQLRQELVDEVEIVARQPRFFKDGELLLVRLKPSPTVYTAELPAGPQAR